jgi:hypothetical protein
MKSRPSSMLLVVAAVGGWTTAALTKPITTETGKAVPPERIYVAELTLPSPGHTAKVTFLRDAAHTGSACTQYSGRWQARVRHPLWGVSDAVPCAWAAPVRVGDQRRCLPQVFRGAFHSPRRRSGAVISHFPAVAIQAAASGED